MTEVKFSKIPAWLCAIPRWVLWRDENGKKVPCSVRNGRKISITKQENCWTFDQAVEALKSQPASGIGIVLNGDGLVAVDLDDCLTQDAQLMPGVQDLLYQLGATYVEVSPSGRGLHVFGFTNEPSHKGVHSELAGINVELYSDLRYVTVTGNRIGPVDVDRCESILPGYGALLTSLTDNSIRSAANSENQLTQETQDIQDVQDSHDAQDVQARVGGHSFSMENMPVTCHVDHPGQRNRKCFELARWLKSEDPGARVEDFRWAVELWHAKFKDKMGTQNFHETWVDFCYCWGKVKKPFGCVLDEQMKNLPVLPDSMQHHEFGPSGDKLLRLCVGLAQRSQDGNFFLSGHAAAQAIGQSPQWIYKLLGASTQCGYLKLLKKGKRHSASEYRLGDQYSSELDLGQCL